MDLEKLIEIRHDLLKGVEDGDMNDVMWAINDLDTLISKESRLAEGPKQEIKEPEREFKKGDAVRITGDNTNHGIPLKTVHVLEYRNLPDSWLISHSGCMLYVLESDMKHAT